MREPEAAPDPAEPRFRRVLVKLTGESLCGAGGFGVDSEELRRVASIAVSARRLDVQLGLVVGAGNLVRGGRLAREGVVRRTTADSMGMLATVVNALALRDAIESLGVGATVLGALEMPRIADPFVPGVAVRALEEGRIVLFAGGTGNPFFTTDTAAALRAVEIEAELLVKATKVDGVYDEDPVQNPKARRFERLEYMDLIRGRLAVMDATAVTLCMENRLPVVVLDLKREGSLVRAICGKREGTWIGG